MKKIKSLTGKQKARLITFAVIILYLLYGVLACVWEVRMQTTEIEYVDSVQIDGSEIAPLANLFVAGANGLIGFVTTIMSVVAKIECKVTKYLLIGFVVLSIGIGLIMLKFANLIFIIVLMATPALFIWLLALLPMRSTCLKTNASDDEE